MWNVVLRAWCVQSKMLYAPTSHYPPQRVPARCVAHKEKTLVVYHKVTVFFACEIREFSKISHSNACGMVQASAVTWHNPVPPDGRLADLACTGAP